MVEERASAPVEKRQCYCYSSVISCLAVLGGLRCAMLCAVHSRYEASLREVRIPTSSAQGVTKPISSKQIVHLKTIYKYRLKYYMY